MKLTIGSRRSALAQAQARQVADRLVAANPGLEIDWKWITTSGDRIQDRQLSEVGGKGLFLKEIQMAMLDNEIDIAIHSAKDIPAAQIDGLVIAATPPRANRLDAVCYANPSLDLAAANIGTGSLRRQIQVKSYWPGSTTTPIRGNIDTRLAMVSDGHVDAVILAAAGLDRLAPDWPGTTKPLEWMLPAPSQGTLALECRTSDTETIDLLQSVNCETTWLEFCAEREVVAAVGGDCFLPLAVDAQVDNNTLNVRARLWSDDGRASARESESGPISEAADIGRRVGQSLRTNSATVR